MPLAPRPARGTRKCKNTHLGVAAAAAFDMPPQELMPPIAAAHLQVDLLLDGFDPPGAPVPPPPFGLVIMRSVQAEHHVVH